MYPTDQSISSYSSNPSTPVNSPPPLTSQTPHSLNQTSSSSGPASWQQLTPVINGGPNSGLGGMQNNTYTPELVTRGLHMVIKILFF